MRTKLTNTTMENAIRAYQNEFGVNPHHAHVPDGDDVWHINFYTDALLTPSRGLDGVAMAGMSPEEFIAEVKFGTLGGGIYLQTEFEDICLDDDHD